MAGFGKLLARNRNYRNLWFGQVVSEIGDHFNTIAVFSLVLKNTNSGFAVSGRVLHTKFGPGTIEAVDGNKLTVEFDKAGRKMVLDSFVESLG